MFYVEYAGLWPPVEWIEPISETGEEMGRILLGRGNLRLNVGS
jgi:hypothetical protein